MRQSVGLKRRWEDSSSKADVIARKEEIARERESTEVKCRPKRWLVPAFRPVGGSVTHDGEEPPV